jgi:hypothetical protein
MELGRTRFHGSMIFHRKRALDLVGFRVFEIMITGDFLKMGAVGFDMLLFQHSKLESESSFAARPAF